MGNGMKGSKSWDTDSTAETTPRDPGGVSP